MGTCDKPAVCDAFVCEAVFPGIYECMEKKGQFILSDRVYREKKAQIDRLIQSCPTGSVLLTGTTREQKGKVPG